MPTLRRASLLTVIILALLLTACGVNQSDEPDGAPSSDAPTKDSEQAAPSPSATPEAADAEATLREYLAAYGSGDAPKACGLELPAYSKAQLKSAVDQDGVKAGASCEDVLEWGHDLMVAFGANLDPKGLTVSVQGRKATAPATYEESGKFTYFLTFVDGQWLVSGDSDLGYFG